MTLCDGQRGKVAGKYLQLVNMKTIRLTFQAFAKGLLYTFIGGNIGPIMSGGQYRLSSKGNCGRRQYTGMPEQAAAFGVPLSHLLWSAGISLLLSGLATIFWMVGSTLCPFFIMKL